MELNLDNFSIRRTNPSIAGSTGFSLGEERYIAKAQGLVGFEIFAKFNFSSKYWLVLQV